MIKMQNFHENVNTHTILFCPCMSKFKSGPSTKHIFPSCTTAHNTFSISATGIPKFVKLFCEKQKNSIYLNFNATVW